MPANSEPSANLTEKRPGFPGLCAGGQYVKVVFYVCTPLALYQSLNQLFKIFDSMMASYIGASSVSSVAYLPRST